MKKIGFTLIELLVVIAIIAILSGILFPVFATVREKARQSQCLSNEKQLALGMIQYTQDFDGHYPGYCNYGFGGDWGDPVYPYVKSTAVFHCPDYPDSYGATYLMNGFLGCLTTYNYSATVPVANQSEGAAAAGTILCSGADYKGENSSGMIASKLPLPTVTWLFWEGNNYYYTVKPANSICTPLFGTPGSATAFCPSFEVLNQNLAIGLAVNPNYCPSLVGGPFTVCSNNGDQGIYYQNLHHGMNICYTDGHAKFMVQNQLRSLGTATSFAGYTEGVATGWHSNGVSDQEPNL